MTPIPWLRLAIAAGALALAGLIGWTVNGWRYESKLSDLKNDYAQRDQNAANDALKLQQKLDRERDDHAAELVAIDKAGTDVLRKKENELQTLRADVATGRVGLRVAATCPATSGDVSRAAPGGIVDSGTGPTLTAAAGQDYLALRAAINGTETKLAACQRALGTFSRHGATLVSPAVNALNQP